MSTTTTAAQLARMPIPFKQHLLARLEERQAERQNKGAEFDATRYDPAVYIRDRLGWAPWNGTNEEPGQIQVLEAYVLALRQQHEKRDYEAGDLAEEDLRYWKPGQVIKNRIRVEAGHTVGKTKISSGIVNHFFDHFRPS